MFRIALLLTCLLRLAFASSFAALRINRDASNRKRSLKKEKRQTFEMSGALVFSPYVSFFFFTGSRKSETDDGKLLDLAARIGAEPSETPL